MENSFVKRAVAERKRPAKKVQTKKPQQQKANLFANFRFANKNLPARDAELILKLNKTDLKITQTVIPPASITKKSPKDITSSTVY